MRRNSFQKILYNCQLTVFLRAGHIHMTLYATCRHPHSQALSARVDV